MRQSGLQRTLFMIVETSRRDEFLFLVSRFFFLFASLPPSPRSQKEKKTVLRRYALTYVTHETNSQGSAPSRRYLRPRLASALQAPV